MKIYNGLQDKALKPRPRAVAIGIFDGVHRGHQRILRQMLRQARVFHARSMVITFDPHPQKILQPRLQHPILISLAHRLRFFERMGVDEALVIPFEKKISKIKHSQFLEELLVKRLGLRSLSVGYDFRFGYRGLGGVDFLRAQSRKMGYHLFVAPAVKHGREVISSTRVRCLMESGQLKKAAAMLGRPVSIYGTVVLGHGRGRSMGFPTANLNLHHEALPPAGVYAVRGDWKGRPLQGVVHLGQRPTFGEKDKSVEVHFFNFHENLYGKELELRFVAKLRSVKKFQNQQALARAIEADISKARLLLRQRTH